MKQYVAPTLPWAMASGGISLAILCVIAWIARGSDRHDLAIFLFGGSLVLLLLAWLCRVCALRVQVKTTATIIVAYGTIFCTFTCLSANHRGTDLLGAFPFCMILLVIGSFFAMNIWQLLTGYLGTMIPPTILAAHVRMELTGGLFRNLLLLTLSTGLTFFILVSRFARITSNCSTRNASDPDAIRSLAF
ncbi:MAG: hypothetical protein ACR2OU_00075 [Thermomicrobiales bacterium]